MNTITREQVEAYGVNFDELLDDVQEHVYGDHLKGDIFERETVVEIRQEQFPELPPEFHGYWRTETYRHSMENGRCDDPVNELHRVKQVQQIKLAWVHDFV